MRRCIHFEGYSRLVFFCVSLISHGLNQSMLISITIHFLSRTALPRYLGCLRSCLFHFIRIKNVLVAVICFVSFYQLLACGYFKCYFNYCVSQRKNVILIDICCATHVICGTKNLFMWFNILSIFDILFEIAKVSTTSTPILLLSAVKS